VGPAELWAAFGQLPVGRMLLEHYFLVWVVLQSELEPEASPPQDIAGAAGKRRSAIQA